MIHSFISLRYISFFIAGTVCICSLFVDSNRDEEQARNYQVINNIKALSKVYGYVRYFYSGDEAASVDWE